MWKTLNEEKAEIWHLKTTTVPVIVTALDMIKEETDKLINKMPGSPSCYEMQKNCTLRNCLSPEENTINKTGKHPSKEAVKIII